MNAVNINYDDLLIGRTQYIDTNNFYGQIAGEQNEQETLACIRYVLEGVLGWTPDEAIRKLDSYTIKLLKLDKLINYIQYPPEIPDGHPKYILALLYPEKVKIDQKKMAEDVFKTVLAASDDADASLKQFPREYFSGGEGFKRFCLCVTYLLDNYKPMESVEEIYKFFGSAKGRKFLCDFRLKVPADQFAINMLDVIRYITREEPDGELMYCFFMFQKLYNDEIKKRKAALKQSS